MLLPTVNPSERVETAPWWALYTRHQHEKVVAEMLTAKGFEVFLPAYDSIRRWKDRRKVLSLPLFPCYVFVRGQPERRLQVVSTPGVHMLLTRGEQIAVVPEAEIGAIRRAVEGSFRVEPHPFLKVGERVRVTRGSLAGVEGILVRKKNLYRLVLSVDMLAQSVGVEVDASDVEPIQTELNGKGALSAVLAVPELAPAGERWSGGYAETDPSADR
ncbi:MAG: UpxY family transcription antiterminator [Acidobacteriaceae bacterium]